MGYGRIPRTMEIKSVIRIKKHHEFFFMTNKILLFLIIVKWITDFLSKLSLDRYFWAWADKLGR